MRHATLEEQRELRRKPVWSVADFAFYSHVTPKVARSRLRTYDRQLGGLLIMRRGVDAGWWEISAAKLAKLGLFEPIDSLVIRVEALEDVVDQLATTDRRIAGQVGQNTRDIAKMRSRTRVA